MAYSIVSSLTRPAKDRQLPKPNYAFAKRQRDLAKKQKREEKLKKKKTEGVETPALMSVGLHPRMAGRPARARALARFLDHVREHDKVWVCRRLDVAQHWHAHHAPEPNEENANG